MSDHQASMIQVRYLLIMAHLNKEFHSEQGAYECVAERNVLIGGFRKHNWTSLQYRSIRCYHQ
jgi:hypothetical protein